MTANPILSIKAFIASKAASNAVPTALIIISRYPSLSINITTIAITAAITAAIKYIGLANKVWPNETNALPTEPMVEIKPDIAF